MLIYHLSCVKQMSAYITKCSVGILLWFYAPLFTETEKLIQFYLQEFCIDTVDKYVPSNFVTVDGFYSSNPVKHSLDGAFAARLLRSTS